MVDWKGRFSNMLVNMKNDLKPKVYSKGKVQRMGFGNYIQMRQKQLTLGTTPRYMKRRIMTAKKSFQSVMPFIPNQALPGAETAFEKRKVKGYPTRGRPRGTLDPRYAKYGGVFGYRKYVAQQRKLMKQQLNQQAQQIKMARQMQQAPYEYQQFQEQPQQIQPQEMPQQMPQYPQQYPPQPQKRPIATVFKGSGGSPYPPVADRPLASSRETIPYGYVEEVDSFTGRRFLKKLPPKERWTG